MYMHECMRVCWYRLSSRNRKMPGARTVRQIDKEMPLLQFAHFTYNQLLKLKDYCRDNHIKTKMQC